MSKEELIKEAWGKNYNKDVIMKGRRCGFKIITNMEFISIYKGGDWYCEPDTWETIAFMPTTLRQILKNNGWIKIESEDDLPKEDCLCFVYDSFYKEIRTDDFFIINGYFLKSKHMRYSYITHYQPIEKPKPPIF